MPRGIFITFEGSEGCGKTTQIRRLAARFEKLKIPVLIIREPGSTAIGEEIRQLLQFSKAGHAMTPEAELLLFTASRAQLVRELIQPALASGTTVVADRFMDSTTVYQGVARKLDPAAVRFVNEFAVGECYPNMTFVLDLDCDEARRRLQLRARPAGEVADRMEQQPPEFYRAVREGYLQLARREPQRVQVIAGAASADEIEQAIWKQIEPIFNFAEK